MMNYQIVQLQAKKVAGLKIRTNNQSETMGREIGALWQKFYNGAFSSIPGQVTGYGIGLYTNYASDESGDYDMFACCEVTEEAVIPEQFETAVIPAGSYAEFVVHGDVQRDVAAFWEELWQMPLNRSFTGDFEEYRCTDSMENARIHIFIALKDAPKGETGNGSYS